MILHTATVVRLKEMCNISVDYNCHMKGNNMRKLYKHEKTVILLGIIGLILIGISLCPGGWESATGILQGLSTGLWSGIVLFLLMV